MNYGSVCSGIEAATVAWHPLGWKPQWFSQFDPEHNYNKGLDFPSEVLQYHYPIIPNLGDMTKIAHTEIFKDANIDLLVGGTPCQSFSLAGLRNGLADGRGNLSLEFVRLLMLKRPRWFVWENVPGVLSSGKYEENYNQPATHSKDFACILSAFTGLDIAATQTIPTAGIIQGKFYSIAWRVLDSQYFGVPQQRRRIFVVGHLGNDWRPPTAVLFERESMQRTFTKSRQKGAGTTDDFKVNINNTSSGISGAVTKKWAKGTGGPSGSENYNLITQSTYSIQATAIDRKPENGGNGLGIIEEVAPTLTKMDRHGVIAPISFKIRGGKEVGGKGFLGSEERAFTVTTMQDQNLYDGLIVRRFTPLECERLQGFPDGYTNIPGATDNKRYEALGNSMTKNVMQWIGNRIDKVNTLLLK